jgi:anti-sigma B factor antagonist
VHRLEITEYHPEGVHVLIVRGDLDLGTIPELCLRMTRHREGGLSPFSVVDLSDLGFCDSTGLRGLLGEAREAAICGGSMRLVAPVDGIVRRLFDVCGIDQVLDVDPDRETALSRARAASARRRARPATAAAPR